MPVSKSLSARPAVGGRERRLVSLERAAEYTDQSVRSVRRLIASGDLTGYRMGKRAIRVDLNEVDALLRPIPTAGGAA